MKEKDLICKNCIYYQGLNEGKIMCTICMQEFIKNEHYGCICLDLGVLD